MATCSSPIDIAASSRQSSNRNYIQYGIGPQSLGSASSGEQDASCAGENDAIASVVGLDLSTAVEERARLLNEFARIEAEAGAVGAYTPVAPRRRSNADGVPEHPDAKTLSLEFKGGSWTISPRKPLSRPPQMTNMLSRGQQIRPQNLKFQCTLTWLRYSDDADDASCQLSFSNNTNSDEEVTLSFRSPEFDGSRSYSQIFTAETMEMLVPAGDSRQTAVGFSADRSAVGVHSSVLYVGIGSSHGHQAGTYMLLRSTVVAPPIVQVDKTRIEWSHGGSSRLIRVRNGGHSAFALRYSISEEGPEGRFGVASCSHRVVPPEDCASLWLRCAPSSDFHRATLTLQIEPVVEPCSSAAEGARSANNEDVVIRSSRLFDILLIAGSGASTDNGAPVDSKEPHGISALHRFRPDAAKLTEFRVAKDKNLCTASVTSTANERDCNGHVDVNIESVVGESSRNNVNILRDKQKTTKETAKRRDVYFGKSVLAFGNQSVGDCTCLYIHLCNGTKKELTVNISEPSSPFLVVNKRIKLRPRSFVRLPVRFIPQECGCFASILQAETSGGDFDCQLILKGVGTSSEKKAMK